MAQKPEATFGSNVAVWRNDSGRSVTIAPRRYKDQDGNWQNASGWNISDLAHLAHCLTLALNYCLTARSAEDAAPDTRPKQHAPSEPQQPPGDNERGLPF